MYPSGGLLRILLMTLEHRSISARPYLLPLYPGHDTTHLVACSTVGIPINVSQSMAQSGNLVTVAQSVKKQYAHYLTNKDHVWLEAGNIAQQPLLKDWPPMGPNCPYRPEITNLGVMERWLGKETHDELQVGELGLALRMAGTRPMVHCWTAAGSMQIQVQVSWTLDDWMKNQVDMVYRRPTSGTSRIYQT